MAASAPDTSGTRTVASSQLLRTQSETHAPSKSHLLSGANSSRPDVQRQECLVTSWVPNGSVVHLQHSNTASFGSPSPWSR